MTPLIVDKNEKRRRLLLAAADVFIASGYHETRMVDIAHAAGVGKGTLYEYFPNKEELFNQLFSSMVDDHLQTLRLAGAGDTAPRAHLERLITESFAAFDRMAGIYRILFDVKPAQADTKKNSVYTRQFARLYTTYRSEIAAIIRAGIRKGQFRRVPPDLTAATIIAAVEGLLHQWLIDCDAFDPPAMGRQVFAIVRAYVARP